jgi:ribulose-bisphosphate carboxylase large chain
MEKVSSYDFSIRGKKIAGKMTRRTNKSRFYKHKGNFTWQGIRTEEYKTDDNNWAAIARRVLIGRHNESARFHLRYFEILPGGYSSFEKHIHEHVVVGIRGKGKVLCGKKNYELNFLDTLYIAPNELHQLSNPFHEPFGFLCIVNAKRDKPKILKRG